MIYSNFSSVSWKRHEWYWSKWREQCSNPLIVAYPRPPPADDDGCVYRVRQTARKLLTSTAITSTSPPNVRRRMGGGRLTLGLPRVGVRSSDQLLSKVTGWGYGNSYAIWDHRVLPVTRQRWHSRLYPCQLKLELWRSFSSLSSSLCPNYDFE